MDIRSPAATEYRKLYKRKRWLIISAQQLRNHPCCQWCERRGHIVVATICHHDDPKQKLDPNTFHDGPFTSLCKTCHDSEAQEIEAIGFSKRVGLDGWPVDAAHPSNKAR